MSQSNSRISLTVFSCLSVTSLKLSFQLFITRILAVKTKKWFLKIIIKNIFFFFHFQASSRMMIKILMKEKL